VSSAAGVSAGSTERRRTVAGCSSVAHRAPQRQHVPSWRAIGPWQERHSRGKCRLRMPQRPLDGVAGTASAAVVAVASVRAAVSERVDEASHPGGYARTMYLSPRRTLIALRARRAGGLRRGDEVEVGNGLVTLVTWGLEGGSIPATGDAGGAIAGSLCM
jgi:hypothetical protein